MKVKASVKRRCPKCKIVKRKGVIYVTCENSSGLRAGDFHYKYCMRSRRMKGREIIRKYKAGKRDFSRVKLRRAELEGADLRNINLSLAYLVEANLRGANLAGANLKGCNLVEANLREANLTKANLRWANLYEAEVTSTQLAQARSLKGAIMPEGGRHE